MNAAVIQSTEIYDPESDQWTFGPRMCLPRYRNKAIVPNHKLYSIGGDGIDQTIECLDLSNPNAVWKFATDGILNHHFDSDSVAAVVNKQIMMVSDRDVPEIYSVETDQWTRASQPMGLKKRSLGIGMYPLSLVTVKGLPNRKQYCQ